MIREQPWYRREAFCDGLRAAGHTVNVSAPGRVDKGTLLLIWNRYNTWHEIAKQVEAGGGRVLVAENGYVARGGGTPKFDVYTAAGGQQQHYYAIAEGWHNGGGNWPHGGPERWQALGVELQPWRYLKGEYVLVCPNRSFGVGAQVMHPDWAERTAAKLRRQGQLVRIRQHPGNNRPKRPLEADLEGALSVYVWSSSCGVHALIAGIPVTSEAPYWICKDWREVGREAALQRMAWAQWSVEEIASGEPFRHLLPAA